MRNGNGRAPRSGGADLVVNRLIWVADELGEPTSPLDADGVATAEPRYGPPGAPRNDQPQTAIGSAGGLTVEVLGPLVVSVDGRPLRLPAGRLCTLLATLAMSAGQVVSLERLVAALWEGEPPDQARRTVQTYLARLRGVLGAGLIGRTPAGYVLQVAPDRVDALRFAGLLDAAAAAPDARTRRARLREAFGLWRGLPFEGLRSSWLQEAQASPLVERYLAGVELWVDEEVAGGRVEGLAAWLRELVAKHPLRESLWARLLVVLQRCGRQAEALACYESVRVRLAEELGADPGPELQQIHADLLAGRAAAAPRADDGGGEGEDEDSGGGAAVAQQVAQQVVPRQLPMSGDVFTGREAALAAVEGLLGDSDIDGSTHRTAVACVISGMAGVGKTALAVHAAHRLAGRFPDGQLHVNLQGATVGLAPLEPLEVLGRFLRALGADPAIIPTGLEEAAALFRSLIARRRLLLMLDNAANAAQVRPLLPGAPGCGVLVTSRHALVSLEGAAHLQLDALAPTEAMSLLSRLAGQARIAAEPTAAAEVARCCGYLPLALRIAGARLAARPNWPVVALAERLADAQRRLDELEVAEAGVRASFAVSYERLRAGDTAMDRSAASAFGLLGALDGPEFGVPAAARLLDESDEVAERVLERLVDAHLLESPAPGRYRLHDLLRLYAREIAGDQHPEPERTAALTRALGFYIATAWHALQLLRPGDHRLRTADDRWRRGGLEFAEDQAALAWLEAERANLLAAVQQAAASRGVPAEMATQLAHGLFGFFLIRSHWGDCVQANQTALQVARRMGDRAAEAQARMDLGFAHCLQGRTGLALACLQQSLAIRRELGDWCGQAITLGNLGLVYERHGRYEEALACHQECLTIWRDMGDQCGQASGPTKLGGVYERQGQDEEALARHPERLAIYRELIDRRGLAACLSNLGRAYARQGQHAQALASQRESLAIFRELGARDGQADALNHLGIVHHWQGQSDPALACLQQSLAIRRELGDGFGQAESLRDLGVTLRALGRVDEARVHWQQALAIFDRLQTTDADEVRALLDEAPHAGA